MFSCTKDTNETLSVASVAAFNATPKAYPQVVEANMPMRCDPDKIYPGQALHVPQP